jgi:hypothetical protein
LNLIKVIKPLCAKNFKTTGQRFVLKTGPVVLKALQDIELAEETGNSLTQIEIVSNMKIFSMSFIFAGGDSDIAQTMSKWLL